MGSSEYGRGNRKRELHDEEDPTSGKTGEGGHHDESDEKQHRLSKSSKFSGEDYTGVVENSGRTGSLDKSQIQKRDDTLRRSSGSSKWSSDDDDPQIRKERDSYRADIYDSGREWETPRYGRDRAESEGTRGQYVGRKGTRTEAIKTSSGYGISNENYDVIEIQTKPVDYGREQIDAKTIPNEGGHIQNNSLREDNFDFCEAKTTMQNGSMPGSYAGNLNGVAQGGRGTTGQQHFTMPLPMGTSFGPIGLPHTSLSQPLNHTIPPSPCTQIPPNTLLHPISPIGWQGPNNVDMNILSVQHGFSSVPTGPKDPRYPPAIGSSWNPVTYFNQGSGRGMPSTLSGAFPNAIGWVHPRGNVPLGKAPSRGEQNDYSQNFVDTGLRPQNFIRELDLTNVVEDYPRLRELIQKKDEIVTKSSTPPMFYKCDLREHILSPEFFGTKFDVILVDPPWEEYVHRAPGVSDHMEYWTFEEILNLKIEAIADTPSFIFLWVGDGIGLEQGRQCLKKWGFRRCEDICWVKTNKTNATPGLRHDSHTLFQHTKEHCLMGIKGTVRRSTDGHIIHANIDTDVIIAEEPPYGSTGKPEDMYRIVEHFSLGRRRLELFGSDRNIRSGWLTLGKELSSSNFDPKTYIQNFTDRDGKVWQGGGGRNPPPEAPHLVLTTPDIESLRPKSPLKNQYQIQQEVAAITCPTTPARPPENALPLNPSTQAPWVFGSGECATYNSDGTAYDVHAYNFSYTPPNNFVAGYERNGPGNML